MSHPLFVLAFVAAMFLAVWALGRIAGMRSREHVRCPRDQEDFEVDFERHLGADWSPGQRHDVVRCTAFARPEEITCDRACLRA